MKKLPAMQGEEAGLTWQKNLQCYNESGMAATWL